MARPVVQLCILMLAVPAQYLITLWTSPNPGQVPIQVQRLVTALQTFYKKWVNPSNWLKEIEKLWLWIRDDRGECIAAEVMKYRSLAGHFAYSPEPRTDRPDKVKYRVGQVFQHKSRGYFGVIVGWDEHAKAPDDWLADEYGKHNTLQNIEPHYAVLPDKQHSMLTRDYVRQEDIEIVQGRKIMNDFVTDYFDGFDGILYIPRPSLRELYPED